MEFLNVTHWLCCGSFPPVRYTMSQFFQTAPDSIKSAAINHNEKKQGLLSPHPWMTLDWLLFGNACNSAAHNKTFSITGLWIYHNWMHIYCKCIHSYGSVFSNGFWMNILFYKISIRPKCVGVRMKPISLRILWLDSLSFILYLHYYIYYKTTESFQTFLPNTVLTIQNQHCLSKESLQSIKTPRL